MPVMCTEIESGGRRNRIPLADAVKTLAPHWHMKAKDIETLLVNGWRGSIYGTAYSMRLEDRPVMKAG